MLAREPRRIAGASDGGVAGTIGLGGRKNAGKLPNELLNVPPKLMKRGSLGNTGSVGNSGSVGNMGSVGYVTPGPIPGMAIGPPTSTKNPSPRGGGGMNWLN